jgi:hypothetical protein
MRFSGHISSVSSYVPEAASQTSAAANYLGIEKKWRWLETRAPPNPYHPSEMGQTH